MGKPDIKLIIGLDALPYSIRNSKVLTGNDLELLSNVHSVPDVDVSFHDDRMKNIFQYYAVNPEEMENELHIYARELLAEGKIKEAWQVLLTLNT